MNEPRITSDLPVTKDIHGREILKGSKVRSFDFPDICRDPTAKGASFVEGIVIGVEQQSFDCPRYAIRPTRCVFDGNEQEVPDFLIFPPLNGTQRMFGKECNGVEVVS